MKTLRAFGRLTHTALHLLGGVLIVGLAYPWSKAPRRLALKQVWSARLLRCLGIRLTTAGPLPAHGLVVANHISFIDIFALNAVGACAFVARADIAQWPLIGWLSRHTDTLFLTRGSRAAAQRARENLVDALKRGRRTVVFPEGTTSLGHDVLPFHSALLQAAIDAGTDVVPVALRYRDGTGHATEAAAYVGEMTLFESLWRIACQPAITVEVIVLAPLSSQGVDRRHLSAHAHRAIRHALTDG